MEKPENGMRGLKHWRYDLLAGLQVALIGLPLSLGIAVASGAPPITGVISAIIAGLIFPFLGGAYVTISGPAAGLAPALLAGMIALGHGDLAAGYPLLLVAICLTGVVQLLLSLFRAGRFALYFPISVVEGMLSAIGMLIIIKQIPLLLGDQLPVPTIVTSHGGDVYEHNVRLQKPVVQARCVEGLRAASALVAIGRFTRDGFARLCPEAVPRIVDIPNGVHVANFADRAAVPMDWDYNLKPGSYAVFLGRLKRRKGVDVLLEAMTRLPGVGRVQLVIAGDGEERSALEALSEKLGLKSRVRFLGSTTGQAKTYLLQNARFGVIPSRQWEAFGLVVLEGYASGLPMIATDMPGLADLIQPETTGLLVPPESPEPLAAAMQRLFADDALVARMSAAGRQVVQQYDWSNVARRHVELYERLIAGRRAQAA